VGLRILLMSNHGAVRSGYGTTTAHLARMWKAMGHDVGIFAFYGQQGIISEWEGFPCYGSGMDSFGNDVVWSHSLKFGADIVATNIDPHVLMNFGSGAKPWLCLAPVMEDPLIGPIKHSLQGVTDIVSISKYSQRVLKEAGFDSTMIPLPVACETFHPLPKDKAKEMLGISPDMFLIGNVGMNRGNRKGHDILLQAFQYVLAEVPSARLMVHTDIRQSDGMRLDDIATKLGIRDKCLFPSPYDAFFGLPTSNVVAMMNAFDIYVQPSRNEGQCMPIYEAMSCGCPVIATNATALEEAMAGAEGIPLEAHKVLNQSQSWGYECTVDDLANAIITAYQKWGRGYCSLQNRQWAIENVSIPVVGLKWQEFLWNLEKKIRFAPTVRPWKHRPSVVNVSTVIKNCGIAAYTRSQQASMSQATEEIPTVDVTQVHAANQIPDADIVHWHYEPSINPPKATVHQIFRELRNRGSSVVVTYHNIDSGAIKEQIEKNLINAALVHWPITGLPNHPKVHILGGMGCPTFHPPRKDERDRYREQYGFAPGEIVISTFGFAAVGRGHCEIVAELAPYLRANPNIKVQLIIPGNFLNEVGKNIVYDELNNIAKGYEVGHQIILVPDYIPDSEVLKRLWISDIGYLYLGCDTTSSSSAIRFFISARLPTVITPSSHFADVRYGVVRTDSYTVADFTYNILATLQNPRLLAQLKQEHERTYSYFNWPAFGEKILNSYKVSMEQ